MCSSVMVKLTKSECLMNWKGKGQRSTALIFHRKSALPIYLLLKFCIPQHEISEFIVSRDPYISERDVIAFAKRLECILASSLDRFIRRPDGITSYEGTWSRSEQFVLPGLLLTDGDTSFPQYISNSRLLLKLCRQCFRRRCSRSQMPMDQTLLNPIVISELDIWRAANLLIRQDGENAEREAARKADSMLNRGDHDGSLYGCASGGQSRATGCAVRAGALGQDFDQEQGDAGTLAHAGEDAARWDAPSIWSSLARDRAPL